MTLILASQSPRRAQLLREAGLVFEQCSPPFADADQPPGHLRGHEAEAYAERLAREKAASLSATLAGPAVVLAADTICVDADGALVGKPVDADHARVMLRSFVNADHRVITGVVLVRVGAASDSAAAATRRVAGEPQRAHALTFTDTATVTFGTITDRQLDAYLATGEWRGKAGGYNLFDRQRAGWPITVAGEPTTVVGLPMPGVLAALAGLGVRPCR